MKHPRDIKSLDEIPKVFKDGLLERQNFDIETIQTLEREDFVIAAVGWNIGDENWYNRFTDWLDQAGLQITTKAEVNDGGLKK